MDDISRVVIGMDPHKRPATIEAMGPAGQVLGGGRFGTGPAGLEAMLARAAGWQDRVWAAGGCAGIGRHLVLRLPGAGEQVVDGPAKLPARMRVYATGQGRKTDGTDAHSIALAGVGMTGLREVVNDQALEVLRLLDRGGPPHPGPRLLPPQSRRREDPQRGHALTEAQALRPRLQDHARRPRHRRGDGPGRTPGKRL